MIIFTPVLSTDELKAATNGIANFLKTNGAEIEGEDTWGLKSLAYPIQKKTTGLYYVVNYSTSGNFNHKLETQMNRDESILRHMITVLDKHAVAYNDRKRKGIKVEPKVKATSNETTETEA
ncbi:MAG: ribosomal protein [Bacteroidota bacterium]